MPRSRRSSIPSSGGVSRLAGLGPKSEAWLREVGINTEEELRAIGAIAAYRRLKHWNPRLVSLNALYALHAALNGLHWRAVDDATKARLRAEAGVDIKLRPADRTKPSRSA